MESDAAQNRPRARTADADLYSMRLMSRVVAVAARGWLPAKFPRRMQPRSVLFEAHLFKRRRPRVGVDQHQRGLIHARTHPAGPDVLEDRTVPDALVHEALDLVQHSLPLTTIRLHSL